LPKRHKTWDSVAAEPKTAQRLGLKSEDAVELKYQAGYCCAGVGDARHPDESVTVFWDMDDTRRTRGTGGRLDAAGSGPTPRPGLAQTRGTKDGGKWALAATQTHSSMEGGDLVRVATLDEYRKNPAISRSRRKRKNPLSCTPSEIRRLLLGMAIEPERVYRLRRLRGGLPGRKTILRGRQDRSHDGREMHWIRIDRYYEGSSTIRTPTMSPYFDACEDAPCEVVCPVAATVHSPEA